jgi:hypothetical protein
MANIPVNFGGVILTANQSSSGNFAGIMCLGTGSVTNAAGSVISYLGYGNGLLSDGSANTAYMPATTTTTASVVITSASLAPFITPTGSFTVNGVTLTITGSTLPANTSTTMYIASGSTPAATVGNITASFNTYAPSYPTLKYITTAASGSTSTGLIFNTTTSLPGLLGNTYYITSGSTTTNFSGGTNVPALTLRAGDNVPLFITACGVSASSAPVLLYT